MKFNFGQFSVPEHAIVMDNGLLMAIAFEELSADNWEEASELKVADDQADFIAPNLVTIAESQFYPWLKRLVIVDGATKVGFIAYGRDPEDGQYWLYRFMIDRRYQGKGRGKVALQRLIEKLRRDEPECVAITVGYQPENVAAERFYLGAGFEPAGMADWGEKLARLTLPPMND